MSLKGLLTTETLSVGEFEISTFALVAFIIFGVLILLLVIKKKKIEMMNGIKCGFLTLSILTFLFAFLNALTGEFLFSQKNSFKVFMFIATIALFIYIVSSVKDLFRNE